MINNNNNNDSLTIKDNNNGIPLSLADRLFEYRCQLDLANEIIKLLEQQRLIYRSFIEQQCKQLYLEDNNKLLNCLNEIDNQLETLYRKRYDPQISSSDDSIMKYSIPQNLSKSRMLGIDMKTFMNQNSIDTSLNQKQKKSKLISKRRFKCSVDKKCRFVCLTETALLRHQIEHRREKFLQLIQPYGITLSNDYCNVIKIINNENNNDNEIIKSEKCSFPFCTFKFSLKNSDWQIKLSEHFQQQHLSTYIMHPCFICKRMFETKNDLQKHFDFSLICSSSLSECQQQQESIQKSKNKTINSIIPSYKSSATILNNNNNNQDIDVIDDDTDINLNSFDLYYNFDDIGLEVFIENTNNNNNVDTTTNNDFEQLIFDTNDELNSTNNNLLSTDNKSIVNVDNNLNTISSSPNYNYDDHNYNIDGPPPLPSSSSFDDHDDYTKNIDDPLSNEYLTKMDTTTDKIINNQNNNNNNDDEQQLKQLFNIYIFECTNCTYSFQSEQELSLHNYIVHNIPSFNCNQCDYVTQDIEKYQQHLQHFHQQQQQQQQQNNDEFICKICTKIFSNNYNLKQHLNNNHKTYKCQYCNLILMNRILLRTHMQSFHLDCLNQCSICKYKTFDKLLYEQHCLKHNQYKCCTYPDCNDEFATDDNLDAHINRFHLFIKPYKCDQCSEKFYSQRILNKHLIKIHKKFLFNCNQCSFHTNNKSILSKHEQCHSLIKPFECKEQGCFRKFRSRYQLLSHNRHRHCQRKDFKCTIDNKNCEKQFKTKQQLKQHIRTAHKNTNSSVINKNENENLTNSNKNNNNDNDGKKSNVQFYVFGGGSLQINHGHTLPLSMIINKNDNANDNNNNNNKSVIMKRSLKEESLLTTTITPINDD